MGAAGEDGDEQSTYARFVALLDADDRRARDLGRGVIEVLLGGPDSEPKRVEVLVTPAQVRRVVETPSPDEEIDETADDRLRELTGSVEWALAMGRPEERFVVFHKTGFDPSTRRELPPLRAPASLEEKRNPRFWSAHDHDDPRFGEPASIFGHRPGGATDLTALLTSMDPVLHHERYVFSTVERLPAGLEPVVTVREPEGLTVVVTEAAANEHELPYDYVAAMVTMRVHSALGAVGLTAAVSTALAEQGISCNVVAGLFHDHLFVPHERGWDVLDALENLREKLPGSLVPGNAAAQLSVRRGREAVDFYRAAFDARVVFQVGDEDNSEVVAQLVVGDATFWVADEAPEHGNHSPESLGGATTRMLLVVDDPAAVVARAVEAGARLVAEVEDNHAWLLGRVEDPFGHSWEIGKPLIAWPPPSL